MFQPLRPMAALDTAAAAKQIDAAIDAHAAAEKKLGGPLLPPRYRDGSELKTIKTADGVTIHLIAEYHNDAKSLRLLKDAVGGLGGTQSSSLLFVAEGGGKGRQAPEHTPLYALEQISRDQKVPLINPVRNMSEPQTFEATLSTNKGTVTKQELLGYISASHAMSTPGRSGFDLLNGVEQLRQSWNTKEKTNVTVGELYEAGSLALDFKGDRIRQFRALSEGAGDLSKWETAEALIKKGAGANPPFTRAEVLGAMLVVQSPRAERGSPDFAHTVATIQKSYGKLASAAEIHDSLVTMLAGMNRDPEATTNRNRQIGQMVAKTQNQLLADELRGYLKQHPEVRIVIAVAGTQHSGGFEALAK